MKFLILMLLTCVTHPAFADTYKCIQSGKTTYSTSPCGDNAQVVSNGNTPLNESPITRYQAWIQQKIRRNIVLPPDIPSHVAVEFDVTLLPGGSVVSTILIKSSGYENFDQAVERAILKSDPLPIPPDEALFKNFRELRIRISPVE